MDSSDSDSDESGPSQKKQIDHDKVKLLAECLKEKIKNWYDNRRQRAWTENAGWPMKDLFIPPTITFLDSRSSMSYRDVDSQCKMCSRDIFLHEKFRFNTRIVLEGGPGSGKTFAMTELAYQWCQGDFGDVGAVIIVPLRLVQGLRLVQAIRQLYIPDGSPLTEGDIAEILNSTEVKVWLFLEDVDHYSGAEVTNVLQAKEFANCKVVATSVSDYVQEPSSCPIVRVEPFSERDRRGYIEQVFRGEVAKRELNDAISSNTVIHDICGVPLLFTLVVHNIENVHKLHKGQFENCTTLMRSIVNEKYQKGNAGVQDMECGKPQTQSLSERIKGLFYVGPSSEDKSTTISLEELAFSGLVSKPKQLFWSEDYLKRTLINFSRWVESGILIVDDIVDEFTSNKKAEEEEVGESILQNEQQQGLEEVMETDQQESPANASSLPSRNDSVPLRFLSTLFQEWFAANYLASLFQGGGSDKTRFMDDLQKMNPADLFYVLRFTCNLCPESFHVIVRYLMKKFRKDDWEKKMPRYIINYICLCAIEFTGRKDQRFKEAMAEVCQENIYIDGNDSKLLQQAKVTMLTAVSGAGVPIKYLKVSDVIRSVTADYLVLDTGVRVGKLETLESIEISRFDRNIDDIVVPDLIKFVANNSGLKTATLSFPSRPPPVTDEKTAIKLVASNVKVEWKIGYYTEELINGRRWEIEARFKSIIDAHDDEKERRGPANLRTEKIISSKGGILEVPDGHLRLEIPEGALEEDILIQLKLVPRWKVQNTASTFSGNSPGVVEILPTNLVLRKSAKVTLPHCAYLKTDVKRVVKVMSSYHPYGTKPMWKMNKEVPYEIYDDSYSLWVKKFGWYMVEFEEDMIAGKRIKVFIAKGEDCIRDTKHVEIGYHLDLPGEVNMVHRNRMEIILERPFTYYKEGRIPLKISLDRFEPIFNWHSSESLDKEKKVSWENLALLGEYSHPYILMKKDDGDTIVYFKVEQGSQEPVSLEMYIKGSRKQPPSGMGSGPDAVISQRAVMKISMHVTKNWKILGRIINMDESYLESIEEEHADNQREINYQMLMRWRRDVGDQATYAALTNALREFGRPDLIELLANYYVPVGAAQLTRASTSTASDQSSQGGVKRGSDTQFSEGHSSQSAGETDGSVTKDAETQCSDG